MSSQVQIWQSSFMKFVLSQQYQLWFRSRAASTVFINILAMILASTERHLQMTMWILPSMVSYSSYHSSVCLAFMAIFSYNILDFTIRYLHCCYRLSCKFVVNTEEERLNLSRSFHGLGNSLVTVSNGSPISALSPSSQGPASVRSPSSPGLFLPSAAAAAAAAASSAGKSPARSPSVLMKLGVRDPLQQPLSSPTPPPTPRRRLGSPAASPPASVSPRRADVARLSASLLIPVLDQSASLVSPLTPPGAGAAGHLGIQHQPPASLDYSHLASLRYQLGTPGGRPRKQQVEIQRQDSQEQQQQQRPSQQQLFARQSYLTPAETLSAYLPDSGTASCRIVDHWLKGIRAWLHDSIVEPLARDIDRANGQLRLAGCQEVLVGLASPQQLAAASAAQAAAPGLAQLAPYLAACEDQGYLVRRLGELASVPCLGSYRWDCGSPSPGVWSPTRHPSDSHLLLQLVSAYLDRCLPPLPGNGKPFGSVYTRCCQGQQQHHQQALAECQIVQSSKQPPHYQLYLLAGSVTLDVPSGPPNLFHCLALFFRHYQTRCGGRMGHLSLGAGGLNLDWVFLDNAALTDLDRLIAGPG